MKILYIFSLFLFAFGLTGHGAELERYGDTSWSIIRSSSDGLFFSADNIKGDEYARLIITYASNLEWRALLVADPFLVTNKEGKSNAMLTFHGKKPFSITGRSIKSYVGYGTTDHGLLSFKWCNGAVVNWLASKELVEVSIEEMGGTQKVFTFDTHGLKEVMLEAQRRQRALKD